MSSAQPNSVFSKIVLASDHAGFERKEYIKKCLTEGGYELEDAGPSALIAGDDYPDIIRPAVAALPEGASAIIFGKSGQGEAIVANRQRGVRAAVYLGGPLEIVSLTREDNDANVLSIGAGFVTDHDAWEAVKLFISTPYSGDERHARRIKKIDE